MTVTPPAMEQFRLEFQDNGLVHLVFDAPGRTMNVFSNAAIHELGAFAAWLGTSDVCGVLVRSGKDTAFCAGADLTELGVAYDMIVAAPERARFNIAFDHFFPLSAALRALETAGKPVASAIAGLALGGGCELALATHYRVLADSPRAALGLPESLVGLLPGAGGTQRLPRLIGVERALPILLEGARLGGAEAVAAGLVHECVPAGEEVAAAEAWLLAAINAAQPWDLAAWSDPRPAAVSGAINPVRAKVLDETGGRYPAPIAILDCVEHGLPQTFEGAIRSEMSIFSHLIQRPEPRNMIQTLFLGKTDHDRLARKDALPAFIAEVVEALQPLKGEWSDARARDKATAIVAPWVACATAEELRMADYAVVSQLGYPAYLGGPFALRTHLPTAI
jgi:3-hydroxyacyl-CoA dehydrogenase/enoyl-CoA hydratase/3-hydroxybutyryl-CoA epimerase